MHYKKLRNKDWEKIEERIEKSYAVEKGNTCQ
jgi:hypothetical protein